MSENLVSSENPITKEVVTDSVEIIGEKDPEEYLQAYSVTCSIITMVNREHHVAGIIHVSEGGDAELIVGEVIYKAREHGLGLEEFEYKMHRGTTSVFHKIADALANTDALIDLNYLENNPAPGIQISKSTGEMSFFYFNPGDAEEPDF